MTDQAAPMPFDPATREVDEIFEAAQRVYFAAAAQVVKAGLLKLQQDRPLHAEAASRHMTEPGFGWSIALAICDGRWQAAIRLCRKGVPFCEIPFSGRVVDSSNVN